MICEQVQTWLPLYALDALEPGDTQSLRAHLATGCPACNGRLAEYHAAAAQIPLALDPAAPGADARRRLEEKLLHRADTAPAPIPFPAAGGLPWWQLAAAILVAVLTGAVATQQLMQKHLRDAQDATAVRLHEVIMQAAHAEALAVARALQIKELDQKLASRDAAYKQLARNAQLTEDMLKFPHWKIATVDSKDPAHQLEFGRICFDTRTGTTHFYAVNMTDPGPGKTYQLWLITDKKRMISVGTFDVKNAQGEVVNPQVTIPPEAGSVMLAAVTVEAAGGVTQPTSEPRLVGSLQDVH